MSRSLFGEKCWYLCSFLIPMPGCVRIWQQMKTDFRVEICMGGFLKGLPVIQNGNGQRFLLPGEWCLFFVLLFWLNGKNAKDFTVGMGMQRLIRTKNMGTAWREKWSTSLICVTMYFMAAYGSICLICAGAGQGRQVLMYLRGKEAILQIGIPLLASWMMSIWQLVISMKTNAVCGMLVCICVLTMSAYSMEWFLPGNYLMKLRVNALLDGGIHIEWMMIWLLFGLAAGIIVGGYMMKRMDFMQKKGDF